MRAIQFKTNTCYQFSKNKQYRIINNWTSKIKKKSVLAVETLCFDENMFSPNSKFLVLRVHGRKLHIFSLREDLILLKTFSFEFKPKRLFLSNWNIFISHSHGRSFTCLGLSEMYVLKKKNRKSLHMHSQKIETLDYLRKRIENFNGVVTGSVQSSSLKANVQLPKAPEYLEIEGKSTKSKQMKRVRKLCSRLADLENSLSRPIGRSKILDFLEQQVGFYEQFLANNK